MLSIYISPIPAELPRGEKKALESQAGRRLLARALKRSGALPADFPANLPPEDGIEALLQYGPHGKPAFRELGVHFSISHSHGLAVCGLSGQPLGVDVERVRRFSPALARRITTPGELTLLDSQPDSALTQLWTCKESLMKYTGLGLSQNPREIEFASLGSRPRPAARGTAAFYSLPLLRGEESFWLTLCHASREPVWVEFLPR